MPTPLRGGGFAGVAMPDLIPGVAVGRELSGVRAARIGQVEGLAADCFPRNYECLREVELLTRDQRNAGKEVTVPVADFAAVVKIEIPGTIHVVVVPAAHVDAAPRRARIGDTQGQADLSVDEEIVPRLRQRVLDPMGEIGQMRDYFLLW